MKNNLEDEIYRANFKLKNGYSNPGAYGEIDPLTAIFIFLFLGSFLFIALTK